jgi:hypothetical protein
LCGIFLGKTENKKTKNWILAGKYQLKYIDLCIN